MIAGLTKGAIREDCVAYVCTPAGRAWAEGSCAA